MATKRRTTQPYSEAVRRRALKMSAEGLSIEAISAKLGCSPTSVSNWRKQDRFGGSTRRAESQTSGLPTIKAPSVRVSKPRPLVAVEYACPHCGGRVSMSRAA